MEQTFTNIIDIIYAAKKSGVEFVLNDDKLQLRFPEGRSIEATLLAEIRTNKEAIISFLRNDDWRSKASNNAREPITPFNRLEQVHVPLSYAQERLWFIDKLEGSVQYHTMVCLRVKGHLDKEALSFAFKKLIERHEVLRSVYYESEGHVYQKAKDAEGWQMNFIEGESLAYDKELLDKTISELNRQPFNLAKDDLLRASLISLGSNEYILLATIHHIASDAWSTPIIVSEISQAYNQYLQGNTKALPALSLQFSDYAVWEKGALKADRLAEKLDYWKRKLSDFTPLQLPYDFDRTMQRSVNGRSINYKIQKPLADKLVELSKKYDCSLYMVLLATYNVLLYRYCNQTDICVGASVANRNEPELEQLVGFFVNTVVFRNKIDPGTSFIGFLQQVKTTTLAAYQHQDVPFEKVVEAVVKERDNSRATLFNVMLVFINTPGEGGRTLEGLQISPEPVASAVSKFDFTFFVNQGSNGLNITVEYNADLFRQETIEQLVNNYHNLLEQVADEPVCTVSKLQVLSAGQTNYILQNLSTSAVSLPKGENIISLFQQQVQQHAASMAIAFEGNEWSYKQLNAQANQVAHYLRQHHIGVGDFVPLIVDAGPDMLASLIGILKTGAAYVPIDVSLPAQRVLLMMRDCQAAIALVGDNQAQMLIAAGNTTVKLVLANDPVLEAQPNTDPPLIIGDGHVAYVIYTSGSTGTPKGVAITHLNLVDYCVGLSQQLPIKQCHSFALVSSVATDLGNTVLFSSIIYGGCLHLFSKQTIGNAYELHKYFVANKIDCLKIVPSHWKALHFNDKKLLPAKLLIFGGEVLYSADVADLLNNQTGCTVVNHYGPTETTIGKLLHVLDASLKYGKTVPIGKPFGNTNVYVAMPGIQIAPQGVAGILYISGKGVSHGYINNNEATNIRFIDDPWNAGHKMYDTGDLVKILPDGNMLFIRRADDQVKIRGYRVELGEIEAVVAAVDLVKQGVVLAKIDDKQQTTLIAYVVPSKGFNKADFIEELRRKLPDYMVPMQVIELDELPMLANGKVDRRTLLSHNGQIQAKLFVLPQNEVEQTLVEIWKEVLELDVLSTNDDFFEQGGHSLLAVRIISLVRKQLNVELPISHIFDYPTIKQLAQQVSTEKSDQLSVGDLRPLTSKYLVTLQKGYGSQPPLYMICGTGGTAFAFKNFTRLMSPNQPVYALQQSNIKEGLEESDYTIEEIAARYLAEIFAQDPEGPYHLAGHCIGGIIAFEMAKQIQRMGKKVALLAMMDTLVVDRTKVDPPSFSNLYYLPKRFARIIQMLGLKLEFETYLLKKYPKNAVGYKLAKLRTFLSKKFKSKFNRKLDPDDFEVFNQISGMYRSAITKYKISPYNGTIVAFYALEHYYFWDKEKNVVFKKMFLTENEKKFWFKYAENVNIHEVDGEHSMIFDHGNAKLFANLLESYIKAE